jgi:hypothetical protein
MSSYVPPHMRTRLNMASMIAPAKAAKAIRTIQKQEFPVIEGFDASKKSEVVVTVNWKEVDFTDEEIAEKEVPLPTGWIDLRYFEADDSLTMEQLHRAADKLEANWKRHYLERDEEIPDYFVHNPYDHFSDFERTIPLYKDYESSESESSEDDYEDPEYESE